MASGERLKAPRPTLVATKASCEAGSEYSMLNTKRSGQRHSAGPTPIELPAIAAALLLDEWRRATMEGQGGWFVRLPRERYDGKGNLWTVVRRPIGDEERIVLTRETKHYQTMAARNELERLESEYGHKLKLKREVDAELLRIRGAMNKKNEEIFTLRKAKLEETSGAADADLRALEPKLEELRRLAGEGGSEEWDFSLDLRGTKLLVLL